MFPTMWLEEPTGIVGDGFQLDVLREQPGHYVINRNKPISFPIADIRQISPSINATVTAIVGSAGQFVPVENPIRARAAGRPVYVLYIQRAGDDMAGTASKRWNEHLACYFAYASLPPRERNRECNIRFLTVSMDAKELELGVSTVEMIL